MRKKQLRFILDLPTNRSGARSLEEVTAQYMEGAYDGSGEEE